MSDNYQEDFASFARQFVQSYWETVKNGDFPMPPNEPVEETVEELIADVSYTTELMNAADKSSALYELVMTSRLGDWWRFGFQRDPAGWNLVKCAARSDDDAQPHDLLDAVYSQYFNPFLMHITDAANLRKRI